MTAGKAVPDRWEKYKKLGRPITGTQFICFKTPLRNTVIDNMDSRLSWSLNELISSVPRLGMVIDLTFANGGYYDSHLLKKYKIKYKKILCMGHVVPNNQVCHEFNEAVDDFAMDPKNHGKLIGVHCTHGLNRSGFLVCQYMITRLSWRSEDAINAFESARGHTMERNNYLNSLKKLQPNWY